MARVYKRSDRLKIKIDDITIEVSPLSISEKTEIQALMIKGRTKGDVKSLSDGLTLILKYGLKGIQGLENMDGSSYSLKYNDGILDDECVNDLMNLEFSDKIALVCTALVNKIPSEFVNEKGEKLEGVEYVKGDATEKK